MGVGDNGRMGGGGGGGGVEREIIVLSLMCSNVLSKGI